MSTFVIISSIVLIVFAAYLVDFRLASRRDALTAQAGSAAARRARRVSGMYVRRTEVRAPVVPLPHEDTPVLVPIHLPRAA